MNNRQLFRDYFGLSKPGVYALINSRHKWAYIGHSSNILTAIADVIDGIVTGKTKHRKLIEHTEYLSVHILETSDEWVSPDDVEHRKIRANYYLKKYKDDGYRLYINKKPIELQVKVEVKKDFNVANDNLLVYVNVTSKNSAIKRVVGVFDTMEEAKQFVEVVYRPMDIVYPVLADNTLTKEYFNARQV